MKVGKLMVCY